MDLKKEIKTLKGEKMAKSFLSPKEIEKLPTLKDGSPDLSQAESETVENVILNCLSNYVVNDRKEGYYINAIAQLILTNEKEFELKEKFKSFLIDVLSDQILRKETEKDENGKEKEIIKGLYRAWVIAQVLGELGVDYSEE